MDKVTSDLILGWLKKKIEDRTSLDPKMWLEISFKLNVLLGDETSRLWDLKQVVAQKKLDILSLMDKKNVSLAQAQIEVSDEYKSMKKQDSKVRNIEEFIRLAKIQSKIEMGI